MVREKFFPFPRLLHYKISLATDGSLSASLRLIRTSITLCYRKRRSESNKILQSSEQGFKIADRELIEFVQVEIDDVVVGVQVVNVPAHHRVGGNSKEIANLYIFLASTRIHAGAVSFAGVWN